MSRLIPALAVLLLFAAGQAQAEPRGLDERMRELHHRCDRGDQHACVEFGRLLEANRNRHDHWRQSNPEYWERRGPEPVVEVWGSPGHLQRLHYECDRGDRRACHEFRKVFEARREHHEEWRRSHPEFWLWMR
jgi:hypothetical protein